MAVGCKAQPAPQPTDGAQPPHRGHGPRPIQYSAPEVNVAIGTSKPSQISGYDALPVTLSNGAKSQVIDFLISTDRKTLARLDKFDLTNDPLFSINVAGRPIRGNPAAKVTVINFDDLECPYCARMHQDALSGHPGALQGQSALHLQGQPAGRDSPWAMRAAVDANCLAAQSSDVYWMYVDYIHSHGQEVNGETRNNAKSFDALDRIARQQATLGKLDAVKLDACLAKQDESQVRASMKEAESLRVEGAPALFVDGERISGAVPEEQLWMVIDRALRAAGVEPPAAPGQPAKTGK
jgi:protein-disulfide isomerase